MSTDRYTRTAAEGSYLLEFSGDTYWQPWNVGFIAYKHEYIDDIYGTRYSDRRRYVYEALNEGLAEALNEGRTTPAQEG